MLPPAIYPIAGIVYILTRPDLLVYVLVLVVSELLNPLCWVSDRMTNKHHKQVFDTVLEQQGVKEVRPFTPEEHAKLATLAGQQQRDQAARQERIRTTVNKHSERIQSTLKQHIDDPKFRGAGSAAQIASFLLWASTSPDNRATFLQSAAKRVLQVPIRLFFPAMRKLAGVANSETYAALAIKSYLKKKGLEHPTETEAVAYAHRNDFRQFGVVAYALGCVPVLSWVFEFTTYVGAGLWAAEMEKDSNYKLVP